MMKPRLLVDVQGMTAEGIIYDVTIPEGADFEEDCFMIHSSDGDVAITHWRPQEEFCTLH